MQLSVETGDWRPEIKIQNSNFRIQKLKLKLNKHYER